MWWGRARLSWGKGEGGCVRSREPSKLHSCSSRVRPSWPFLLFGLGLHATSCGTEAAKTLPFSALRETNQGTSQLTTKVNYTLSIEKWGEIQRCCFPWHPYLVGLDKAHKYWEEHRGWSRLGTLSEVVHHIVEGFLELGRTEAKEEAMFVNIVKSGVMMGFLLKVHVG